MSIRPHDTQHTTQHAATVRLNLPKPEVVAVDVDAEQVEIARNLHAHARCSAAKQTHETHRTPWHAGVLLCAKLHCRDGPAVALCCTLLHYVATLVHAGTGFPLLHCPPGSPSHDRIAPVAHSTPAPRAVCCVTAVAHARTLCFEKISLMLSAVRSATNDVGRLGHSSRSNPIT